MRTESLGFMVLNRLRNQQFTHLYILETHMKKLIALSVALATFGANAALESNVQYKGDTQFSSFCEAVVSDDVSLLKKSLRSKVGIVGLSERSVKKLVVAENGVKCNGTSLKAFSKERQATKVAEFLKGK